MANEFHACCPDPHTLKQGIISKCQNLWRPLSDDPAFILVFIHGNRRLEQGRVRHARKSLNCIWNGTAARWEIGIPPSLSLLLPAPCRAMPATATTMMTRKDISFQINEARIAASNKGDERDCEGERERERAEDGGGHAKTPTTTTKRGGSIIPDLPAAAVLPAGAAKWQFKFWREALETRPRDGWVNCTLA